MDIIHNKRNSKFSVAKSKLEKYSKSQPVFLDASFNSSKDQITPISTYSEVTVDTYISRKTSHFNYLQSNLESSTPIPYTFRTTEPIKGLESYEAKSPPFYMQLDHTIAVLWQIFDDHDFDKNNIGIGQLQWALYFLKGIKDPLEGTKSADVEFAIKTIEDILMENYADMADVVLRSRPQSLISLPTDSKKSINSSSSNYSSTASLGVEIKPRRSGTSYSINYIFQTKEPTPEKTGKKYLHLEKKRKKTNQKFRNLSSISEKYNQETELQKPDDIYKLMNRIKEEQIEKINEDIRSLGHLNKKDVLGSISSAVNPYINYNKLRPVLYDFN